MKVKELIFKLAEYNPEAEIKVIHRESIYYPEYAYDIKLYGCSLCQWRSDPNLDPKQECYSVDFTLERHE